MQIDIWIVYNGKEIDAQVVLDSRAEGIYCNTSFIQKYGISTYRIDCLIYPWNVNGMLNKQGAIRHATILWMGIGMRHWENIKVTITNTGHHEILLGMDWLKVHNPNIDWGTNKLCFNCCPPQCHPIESWNPTIMQMLPVDKWKSQNNNYLDYTTYGMDALQCIMAHKKQYFEPRIRKTTVSTTIAKAERKKTKDIPLDFWKYLFVFSDKEAQWLPKNQPWDHKIDLIPGQQMRKTSVYRLTPPEKITLKEYIDNSLKQGILRWSEVADTCSFFFIDKKDRKLCPVQDYQPLNTITKKNTAPIPLIPELIDKLLGAQFFTKLDIWWGYNNIHICKGDEYKTAFKIPLGLFESLVMTFGLCNAPATFQTFMDTQFADFLETREVVIYLNDILIMAKTICCLVQLTHGILQCLMDLDLYLCPEKCFFNQTLVEYLGLIISEGELHMDPVKLNAVSNWLTLKTMKDVQKFLGFCNFYQRFVKNYSALARPLFNLTKKNAPFHWGAEEEQAFHILQTALTTAPVLLLDYGKPFTLIMDASDYATGAILEQEDAFGWLYPVAYFSKSLQPIERNYEIHNNKLLVIIQLLKHFCHYLQGNEHQTKIFLDHANLQYFTTKQNITQWQSWWALFLATFNYIIIPKPGKLNKADALSRHPDYKEGIVLENAAQVLLMPDKFSIQALHNLAIPTGMDLDLKAALKEGIEADRVTGEKLKQILTSGPQHVTKGLQDWNYKDGLFLYKGLVYIPNNKNLKCKVTQLFHNNVIGHPGQ